MISVKTLNCNPLHYIVSFTLKKQIKKMYILIPRKKGCEYLVSNFV